MAESVRQQAVNIYILGASESGKSSFIRRLVKGFDCQTLMLGKRCYAMELDLSGVFGIPMLVNIREYSGIKDHGILRFQYAKADVCLLFYDSNDKSSFYEASSLHWWCHYLIYGTPVTFLVGNKSDLFTNPRVEKDLISQFMTKYPKVEEHFEISALTGVQIKELFEAVFAHVSQHSGSRGTTYNQIYETDAAIDTANSRVRDIVPYNTKGAYPGICFIVNNNSFDSDNFNIRKGSEKDVENIRSTFGNLGFDVKLAQNLDASTLKKRMLDISKLDHRNHNMFICFVMSHGSPYSVFGVDGLPIDIKRLTDPFSGKLCNSLSGKPKIFIIQACQGHRKHKAVQDQFDHASISDVTIERPSVPEYADILVGYSSINGFVSYRDPQRGSIYIRTLCETVKQCPDLHIVDILTIVNREVAEMEITVMNEEGVGVQVEESCKQMPMFESSLTRHAFLQLKADIGDPKGWSASI